jgi:DNA-binding phage protein
MSIRNLPWKEEPAAEARMTSLGIARTVQDVTLGQINHAQSAYANSRGSLRVVEEHAEKLGRDMSLGQPFFRVILYPKADGTYDIVGGVNRVYALRMCALAEHLNVNTVVISAVVLDPNTPRDKQELLAYTLNLDMGQPVPRDTVRLLALLIIERYPTLGMDVIAKQFRVTQRQLARWQQLSDLKYEIAALGLTTTAMYDNTLEQLARLRSDAAAFTGMASVVAEHGMECEELTRHVNDLIAMPKGQRVPAIQAINRQLVQAGNNPSRFGAPGRKRKRACPFLKRLRQLQLSICPTANVANTKKLEDLVGPRNGKEIPAVVEAIEQAIALLKRLLAQRTQPSAQALKGSRKRRKQSKAKANAR